MENNKAADDKKWCTTNQEYEV